MSSYDKIVKLACKPKNAPPKSKYIEAIIAATWADDGAVSDVCKALAPRFREPNSVVVFKALIVLHTMIRRGATDNVLAHLSQSDVLKLRNVYSANWEGFENPDHLHQYAKYLDCRIRAYRDLKHDVIKVQSESNRDLRNSSVPEEEEQGARNKGKQGSANLSRSKTMMGRKLRSMAVEKGLLRETKVVHQMMDTVVECRFYLDGVDHDLRLEALQMLVRDLLILFQAGNEAVINLLEQYFEMSKIDAAEALSIYRHFCKQTEHVTEYLGVAKKLQNLLNVPVPNLRHAPLSLASALQEYLDDPNFEQNRLEYRTNRSAADGKGAAKPGANKAKTSSSSKPDTKSTSPTPGVPQLPTSVQLPLEQGRTNVEDFFNSIEGNQAKMFNSPGSSPPIFPPQAAPNPFAQMMAGQSFTVPQIATQPTGFIMPQQTAMPNATNTFGIPGQQQPSAPGQFPPFLAAPDQQNFLRPQPTGAGANPFRQSMLVPQSTGMALFGVGNNPAMGLGAPQQQPNANPFSAPNQQMQPMMTGFGQSFFNATVPQQPQQTQLQPQQTQPFQPAPSSAPMGFSNSAFATTTQTQPSVNIPQRPASTPLATFGSAAKSSSPPPALPLKPHMTGTKNPFGPIITPAPPVPKPPTMAEIAFGYGGVRSAGSAPPRSTPQQQPQQQQQQQGLPPQANSGLTGGFNFANSALNPGGTDMGSIASSFAFSNSKPSGGTPSAVSLTSTSTTTGSAFSPSLFSGSTGLTGQTTVGNGIGASTGADPTSLKPQMTGFAGLKPFKPTSSFGAALMDSLPPISGQSGPTSPTGAAGPGAGTVGPSTGVGGLGSLSLGTSEFGKQQTGFGGSLGGLGALNAGANGGITESSTTPASPVGSSTTSRLGVGLRPQLTGGGAANPFRASMAAMNSNSGFGTGTLPNVPPLPTGFGSGSMFGSMQPPTNNSFSSFGQQQGGQQQGQQQQGNASLI